MVMLGMASGYVVYWSWVKRSYLWSVVGMAALIAPAIISDSDGVAPFIQIPVACLVFVTGMFAPKLMGETSSQKAKAEKAPRLHDSD